MNDPDMFARLQDRLDRGGDPFADDDVIAWLDAHPEALERAVQLRADARDLAHRPVVRAAPSLHRRRILGAATAAAAVVAVAFGALPPAGPTPAAVPRIVSASFEELRPRAQLTASFRVHDARYASATASIESYQLVLERR
ncbi:MAG: hypothetical protein JNK15_00205 [Planctomycetes bacterium]|nr:hypothetical protein [Planctomycetota bacterium]